MAHNVKCQYCGQTFDRDKEDFVSVSSRRYAHKKCAEDHQKKMSKEEQDKKEMEEFIKSLLKIEFITPRIHKQIKQYRENYNYTYSGIHRALKYFYQIKNNDPAKANGGIGIVPYCYQEAYNYYYELWQAEQRNKDKVLIDYVPEERKIYIKPPKRKKRIRNIFSFLDKE